MTSNNDFNSRLSQLKAFDKSQDYFNIVNTLDGSFDSITSDIVKKWTSNNTLSKDEKIYLDLYSNIHLSYVKYCLFHSNTMADIQTLIEKFRGRLFEKSQILVLTNTAIFIREQQSNTNNSANENDVILVYIMRMIDALSIAYRLLFDEPSPSRKKLNEEVTDCLRHRHAKNYLYDVKSTADTNQSISINYRHQFFIGCCTFAVALYKENKEDIFKEDERDKKYIYLFAKYVRIMLNKNNFEQNESLLYCIRGILALLTNCVLIKYWLGIMNKALADENDEDAQMKNPFNLDLFSVIVNKLLASKTLQKKTEENDLNNETLLLDTALVFLVKWSDTQTNPTDDDEANTNNNNPPSSFDEPNQLLRCFCSHKQFQNTAQIIIPYIDAKYDRLRLMALRILSSIMNNEDFQKLKVQKPHMAKDLVKLIFGFINQAANQSDHRYKGISFDMLLRYLLRFLVQDFIKKETLPYISQIVGYAKNPDVCALKILRKISTNPDLKNDLLTNNDLNQILPTETGNIYGFNEKIKKIINDIRQNLAPPSEPTTPLVTDNGDNYQVFISYCHDDKDMCKSIEEKLDETKLFTKIWVDEYYMRGNMVETVARNIRQSKVVFVLLSDAYCESDFCRREWTFALEKKIKVYVIFVQENFNRDKYDWVGFNISGEVFYKMHKKNDFQKLIQVIRDTLNKKSNDESNRRSSVSGTRSRTTPSPSTSNVPPSNRQYLEKSIDKWTPEDVQAWCSDNHLHKWCKPLTHYDGKNLLVLRQDLSDVSHIQHVVKENNLNGFDVPRFKSEVDKILSRTMTISRPPTETYRPPTKTYGTKRHIEKSVNK